MSREQFGSFIRCKPKRKFLLIFGKTDGWWGKYLKGFTHVSLMEYINNDFALVFEPMLYGCNTMFRTTLKPCDIQVMKDYTIVEFTVKTTRANRLIMPIFQTCTTIVQYLAGISLGCVLANSLYKKLTCSNHKWLGSKGIYGVNVWVEQQKV